MEGNMNNYKGVMLCSRPNEQLKAPTEKLKYLKKIKFKKNKRPFCSRVEGASCLVQFNIIMVYIIFQIKIELNPALQRHKDWLNMFKLKMIIKKEDIEENKQKQNEKFEKVKELAQKDRIRTKKMKSDFDKLNQNIDNILRKDNDEEKNAQQQKEQKPFKLTEDNINEFKQQNIENDKKIIENDKQQVKEDKQSLKKPKWALTQEEQDNNQDKECDELLDFVNGLDYDQFINDLEVQSMIKALKSRISKLQEKKNWKENAIENYKNKNILQNKVNNQQEDLKSNFSQNSECHSIQSEKTQQAINTLKQQLIQEKKDWDKSVQIFQFSYLFIIYKKQNKSTMEEKIAKHVADEVLRNYKHLGNVHSNQSIRKLLEREASNYINKGFISPPLITINKETTLRKNEIDPNNLPYLHRNPAV
ncbi:hypothetical protein IMG5_190620 [Ichthyophthirius multifiliis]|uniref:Uncharacterized protein n=1 Tax=Ichthyophthirius multifiliis TaxID=5932 RepID=G0R495_ICHMU|nr:hypothetical protein IMG5_190620 [Ichthyophthirius multifiliis]EGR27706.1 hypothetical protein IMG5_190620 [Ichthyophthirius multifiliis]|eukprot:XP_004025158.1 hypothetical protein IMG5_190620 [Ichthyophthirius multifiliis]